MQKDNKIPVQLCKNSIFEGLTPEQIQEILPCISHMVKTYASQEAVYDKGDTVQDLVVVLDGELAVCNEDRDGQRVTVSNIEKNELFGESALFSTSGELQHSVIAKKDAKVLYLSGDFFLMPCDKSCNKKRIHQEIINNILRKLSDEAIMLSKKISYLTASDLKTKIAMYLCETYELNRSLTFNMPLNRDRLAAFFSVARPSLSRELINMKNAGVIDFHRSSVTILDLDRLYAMSRGECTCMPPEK